MQRRRAVIQPAISLSFIDMVSGGMAAALLLFLSVAAAGGSGMGTSRAPHRGDDRSEHAGKQRVGLAVVEIRMNLALGEHDLFAVPAEGVSIFTGGGAPGGAKATVIAASAEPVSLYLRHGIALPALDARTCMADQCGPWMKRTLSPADEGQRIMTIDWNEVPRP